MTQTHAFYKPCGCLSGAVINDPRLFGELSKLQKYAYKHNETYKLMETEDFKKIPWKCPEHKAKK